MRNKAVIALLVIIMVAIISNAWRSQSVTVMSRAQRYLSEELSAALGSTVSVGSVNLAGLNSIVLTDIVLTDRRGEIVAASPKIVVTYNPLRLLTGEAPISAIREISINRPDLHLVEDQDGQWNIKEFFDRPRSDQGEGFGGRIQILNGRAFISKPEGRWELEQINGQLDFAAWPAVKVSLTAKQQETALELSGTANSDGAGTFSLAATDLDIGNYLPLVDLPAAVTITDGRIRELAVTLTRKADGGVGYAGEALIAGLAGTYGEWPLSEADGIVTFTDKQVNLFAVTGLVAGQRVRVGGSIATDLLHPALDLTVTAHKLDVSALPVEMPAAVKGRLTFTAEVEGTSDAPHVTGSFSLTDGAIEGLPLTQAKADLMLQQGVLTVSNLQAAVAGGQLKANGAMALAQGSYQFNITGHGIDTTMLARWLPGLAGSSNFTVAMSGQGPIDKAAVAAVVNMPNGSFQGIAFNGLNASLYYRGGEAILDFLTVGIGQGVVTAEGNLTNNRLKIQFAGQQVPLAALDTAGNQFSGTAQFSGTITGTPASPVVDIQLNAVDGQVLHQPFTAASGKLTMAGDTVTLADLTLYNGEARHRLWGTIGFTGQKPLNLRVVTYKVRAENIVKLIAPEEPLTGNIDSDLILTGTIEAPNAQGRVTLTEGSYQGHLIARAAGEFRYEQGTLTLNDFVINSLNAQAQLQGTMTADRQLDFAITAVGIDLARLHFRSPYPLNGMVDFTGHLAGTPDRPVFNGRLRADNIELNGRPITGVTATVAVTGDNFNIPEFGFRQGDARYSFHGGMNMTAGTVFGKLDVIDGQLANILPLLNVDVAGVDGRLNGSIQLSGTIAQPAIQVTGKLTDGTIKNYPLDSVDVDVAFVNNVITVKRFTAQQGSGIVAIRGTADLNGPLALELGARGVDAGLLTAWLDSDIPVAGQLDIAAQVTGTAADPYVAVSLNINGGSIANATFDDFYGLLILEKGSIHVNQVLLAKGPHRASAYGIIPLAALSKKGRSQATGADQMNLKVSLDGADLSILPLLTDEVKTASGPTKGEVTISGTLVEPLITGSLQIENGMVKLASLSNPIQNIGVDIQFQGDRININNFSGIMGNGSYSLSGTADIAGQTLTNYNLMLTLNQLGIKHKYFNGPLTGALTLTDSGRRPVLSGHLTLENVTIDIPMVPEMEESTLNLGLNLDIYVKNKVHFYNPYLYDVWASGHVKLAGTTRWPTPSGRIVVDRGSVNYLRTPFKITSGSVEFTQMGTLEPVIRLAAQTRLQQTTIDLRIDGPASAMEMHLTSQPAMSQEQIITLLTWRNRGQTDGQSGIGRDELLGLLDMGLHIRFVTELENIFRDAFQLDEFRLVRDTFTSDRSDGQDGTISSREGYNIEMAKYLTDRLLISYSKGLGDEEETLGLRYDVTKRISITGEIDEENQYRFGISTRFSF